MDPMRSNAGRHPSVSSRRRFLKGAAAAAAAIQLDLVELASSLLGGEQAPGPARQPAVRVVFVRPEKPVVVSWPGGNCDVDAQQTLFTATLREAAAKVGVRLDVRDKPMIAAPDIAAWLEGFRGSPPDGLLVCVMELFGGWEAAAKILEGRGKVPTVVYSNLSGFTGNMQALGGAPGTFLAATQDVGWLATGLRMLATVPRMRETRILLLAGDKAADEVVPGLGTTFHVVPRPRFDEEFAKVEETDEVRAIADHYARTAQKVIEPTAADILGAAKNYIAIRRLMVAERCGAVSIDCLGWKNPVCIGFSKLLDEGIPAGCEADREAVLAQLIASLLIDRPGFIQDPSPNTVNNTLIGSHCTSPTRLEGPSSPYRAPFLIRDYHTRTGASMQVLWPEGKDVTAIDFLEAKTIALATGKVRSNIPQPPSGCCRTAVEVDLDGVTDSRDAVDSRTAKGFHQIFVLGNHGRLVKAWAQLAGIPVVPMCG